MTLLARHAVPLLLLLTALPSAPAFSQLPGEPGAGTQRGFAVALDGVWLAVGARLDDERGPDAGAVYLFQHDGGSWVRRSKLLGDPGDRQFGAAVALRGDTLAIGAIGAAGVAGGGTGAVYVFRRRDGGWERQARRVGPPGVRQLGRAVATDGERVAAGAVQSRADGAFGAVYVFSGPAWGARAAVLPADRRPGDRFGESLALSGLALIAGAPGQRLSPRGQATGAAYVFARDGARWQQRARLHDRDGVAGDLFGAAVAMSGDHLMIGAPGANTVVAFRQARGTWGQPLRLAPGDIPRGGARFGAAVAIDDDLAVVGAPFQDLGTVRQPGAAAVFRLRDGGWAELAALEAPDPARLDLFGFSVAVSGGQVVAGAPLADPSGPAAGAVYPFACDSSECHPEEVRP